MRTSALFTIFEKMKNSSFWRAVAFVAIIFCLEVVKANNLYKVNEVGNRQVFAKFCGDGINEVVSASCSWKRKRRSAIMDENEALSFLQFQRSQRNAGRHVRSTSTDIVEECCHEGCALEEVYEYCWQYPTWPTLQKNNNLFICCLSVVYYILRCICTVKSSFRREMTISQMY